MNDKIIWEIKKLKLGEITVYEKNPRKITITEENRLKRSLKQFGLVEKPVLNNDKMSIAGHQRVKILKKLYGDDYEIDCIISNRLLSDDEVVRYNLISNIHNGKWDLEALNKIDINTIQELNLKIDKTGKIIKAKHEEIPEMELQYDEKYDYIVFLFRNRFDLQFIEQYFKLERVQYMNKIGMGRLIEILKNEKD